MYVPLWFEILGHQSDVQVNSQIQYCTFGVTTLGGALIQNELDGVLDHYMSLFPVSY